jgi:hypothetical protein
MTFDTESVRTAFHLLPTHTQYEWSQLASYLMGSGRMLHVIAVSEDGRQLQVHVRIDEQLDRTA